MADASKATEVGPTKKVVRYLGTADVREIDAASWKQVGADDQKKVVWQAPYWEVPVDAFSGAAMRYLEDPQNGFAVVDVPA